MSKTLLAACLAALVAAPAIADRLIIDDDRWYMGEDRPGGPAIDIDDDAWSYVDPQGTVSTQNASADGTCTQLEMSVGITGDACGTLSRAELTTIINVD